MEFETLYQELVHSTAMIRALVAGLTAAEARLKPNPESWSVLEVVCHLYDIEREDFRPRLVAILHRPAEEWAPIDPGSWIIGRGYNQRDLAETLAGFLAEREKSLAWLKSLSTPDWEAEHVDQFGSMKAGEMFTSWVAHDNLHLRQLVELRHARIVSLAAPFDVGYAGEW
jgi:hypothetical protein